MAVFQHPHLTRGIVRTPGGAFVISRGIVSAPDEIGEALGWRRIDEESHVPSPSLVPAEQRAASARRDSATLDGQ
jgi:hypothetical protein